MVTQEARPSSNGDEGDQQRKSFAAAAIRRGDVKISEPILWVEGVPDASSNQHTVSSAVPPGESATSERQSAANPAHGVAVSTDEEPRDSADSIRDEPPLQVKRSSIAARGLQRLTTPVDRLTDQRISTIQTSPGSSNQMQAKKNRRSGTIRTVFRKVFGRRDKSVSTRISSPQSRTRPKHEYTPSDPVIAAPVNKSPGSKKDERRGKTETPHNDSEEDISQVLKPPPMLPFPMNVNAPEPSHMQSNPSNYISFETSPKVHRRRATLPSMVLSPADAAVLQQMWSRPENQRSESPNLSLVQNSNSIPSPMIGVAVTSGANPNRRSRSAGALHELARRGRQVETAELRRRSSEIRYWRTSRVDSQDVERPQSRQNSGVSSMDSTTSSSQQSVAELSDAFADHGSSFHGGSHSVDFGSERESRAHEKAPRAHRSQPSFTLDRPGLPATPRDVFQQRQSKRFTQPSQAPLVRSGDSSPSQQPPTYLSSPSSTGSHPAFLTPPLAQPEAQRQLPVRPKTSTGPTSPQPAQQSVLPTTLPPQSIYDHLAPLYSILRYERTVRKDLETQVMQLRHDMLDLNNTIRQMRGAASYATPSPDHAAIAGVVGTEKSRFSGYDSDGDEDVKGGAVEKEVGVPGSWREEGHMF